MRVFIPKEQPSRRAQPARSSKPGRAFSHAGSGARSIAVCFDRWPVAPGQLSMVDISSVALVEIYAMGRGGVRIFTAGYLLEQARGSGIAPPLWFGC